MSEIYEQVDDLKKIKKEYGEEMSHMCRELFPTILENKGLLYYLLSSHFSKSKYLCEDIIQEDKIYLFKNCIYNYYDKMRDKDEKKVGSKSVRELLKEAGYTLYECKTYEDILKFRKYYTEREALCTFGDPSRIKNHYIFFIVREDADKLDRSLFAYPKREDNYSLSVLDLQFDKGGRQRVSIKSRYNHSVANPDATYSNNLENIAEGLTEAFEREYGFNIGYEYKVNFELDGYVQAKDNKFYKYNYEINNIHYCPNNIIIDNGEVIDKYSDKSRYTFMDYFILDEKEKKIIMYDEEIIDCFVDGLNNITNIEITNEDNYKKIILKLDDEKEVIIKVDKLGRIIGYDNQYLEGCGDEFLSRNICLQELNLSNLEKCGINFLSSNRYLQELNLPELQECGDYFLYFNEILQELKLPKLQRCGKAFLNDNESLQKLDLSKLEKCEDKFLDFNESLQELNLPNLEECGDMFLYCNRVLQEINLPSLKRCGVEFLYRNESLQELDLPKLEICGYGFMAYNEILSRLSLPNLEKCGAYFLKSNKLLQELYLPNLRRCGGWFLYTNDNLLELDLPELEKCGDAFLNFNSVLYRLNMPKLRKCGSGFLQDNTSLQELNLPSLEKYGANFIGGFGELIEVGKKR